MPRPDERRTTCPVCGDTDHTENVRECKSTTFFGCVECREENLRQVQEADRRE